MKEKRVYYLPKILTALLFLVCTVAIFSACSLSNACEHVEGLWMDEQEPTLDAPGKRYTECIKCGEILRTEVVPELDLTEAEVIAKLRASVLKVICYDYDGETEISQGSGFFIDTNGTFITNAHVVKDCYFIKVQVSNGLTYDVDVMYTYNAISSDYAICKAKNCFSSQAIDFSTDAKVGDTVYALGYPNDAFEMSTTSGIITSTEASEGTKHYYANTAKIDHGSSGGILADSKGRVLGITTGMFSDGQYAALKYQDFKQDVGKNHIGFKAPVEYFHTVDKVMLGSYNVDDYFDVYLDVIEETDTSVSYNVFVNLKDRYKNAKIAFDSFTSSISVNVTVTTEFQYRSVEFYGTLNKTEKETDYLYFRFYDKDDLVQGDQQRSYASIYIGGTNDYYGMVISHEVELSASNGTIVFYDLYK